MQQSPINEQIGEMGKKTYIKGDIVTGWKVIGTLVVVVRNKCKHDCNPITLKYNKIIKNE